MRGTLEERFVAKVRLPKRPADQCWLWTASTRDGYGTFWGGSAMRPAHRVAWELVFGPIPDGLCVLHDCDTPLCVNPSHLWLGTDLDNARDKTAKGRNNSPTGKRHANGRKTKCRKGHLLEGDNLVPYYLTRGQRVCRTCFNEYMRAYQKRRRA